MPFDESVVEVENVPVFESASVDPLPAVREIVPTERVAPVPTVQLWFPEIAVSPSVVVPLLSVLASMPPAPTVRVLLPGVIVYPVVVNCSPKALIFVPSVTVPAVPANTAVSPDVVFVAQVCALAPFHHRALDVSHVPVPPRVLFPVEVQERLAANAGVAMAASTTPAADIARCRVLLKRCGVNMA